MPEAPRDVVALRVGEDHPVRLAGLGTAGYHWVALVEGDERIVEVSPTGLAQPANHRIGTSADELFTIRALRPGDDARALCSSAGRGSRTTTPAVSERVVDAARHVAAYAARTSDLRRRDRRRPDGARCAELVDEAPARLVVAAVLAEEAAVGAGQLLLAIGVQRLDLLVARAAMPLARQPEIDVGGARQALGQRAHAGVEGVQRWGRRRRRAGRSARPGACPAR